MDRRAFLAAAVAALWAPRLSAEPHPQVERRFVVALDPGHGGDNSGCVAFDGHTREKAFTLGLAHALADHLARRIPGVHVVWTRSEDTTLTLSDRVAAANDAQADVLISLHANASPSADQNGFETYVVTPERDRRDAAFGAHGSAGMIAQLRRSTARLRAVRLAQGIQREQARLFPERSDRGVKTQDFDVLVGALMPAVLFEAGFLDHEHEGAWMLGPGIIDRIAEGLALPLVDMYRESARI